MNETLRRALEAAFGLERQFQVYRQVFPQQVEPELTHRLCHGEHSPLRIGNREFAVRGNHHAADMVCQDRAVLGRMILDHRMVQSGTLPGGIKFAVLQGMRERRQERLVVFEGTTMAMGGA